MTRGRDKLASHRQPAADAGQVLIDGQPYEHRPAGFGERQKVA